MKFFMLFIFSYVSLFMYLACNNNRRTELIDSVKTGSGQQLSNDSIEFSLNNYYDNNKLIDDIVNKTFDRMTAEQKVSQMIVTSAGVYGRSEYELNSLIKNERIGGVILLKGNKDELNKMINNYNNLSVSKIPLLYFCDAEPSLINNKISGIPEIIPTNQIKSTDKAKEVANEISNIIKDIGFHVNMAPICDVDINKEIIGNRSFGSDKKMVSELAISFINEIQKNNIVAVAKHFPGHGNVKGDSHKELVYIKGNITEQEIFQNVIDAGVIMVMIGHIAIRENAEYDTQGRPSTISKNIVTDLLKNKMKFKGIVVTDAMNMKGVEVVDNPSISAILAGCDIILMPKDENAIHSSLVNFYKTDNALKIQIEGSVKKILRLKTCLNLL